MRRQLIGADELADVAVVVGLVEAKALRSFNGRLRTLDRDRVERALQEEVVVAVGALVLEPDRDTMRLAEDRSLRPFLLYQSDSGRSWAPQGRLGDRAVSRQPRPVDPHQLVIREQPLPPNLIEHAGPAPLLQPPVRRTRRTDPGRVQRVPLHPRPQHHQDRLHRVTVRHPRVVATQRVNRRRRQQRLDLLPQPVRHPPTIIPTDHGAHHRASRSSGTMTLDQQPRQPRPHSYRHRPLALHAISHMRRVR